MVRAVAAASAAAAVSGVVLAQPQAQARAQPAAAAAQAPGPTPTPTPATTPAATVWADEVPYITTPDQVTLAMLEMAGVGPTDRVLDLGSGDGRIVVTAARRFGARGLGVEIDPRLVALSRDNARRAGVAERAEFREQDLFATDLGWASVVTLYLLPEVNLQLRPGLLALRPGTRVVSHDWDMGDWWPDQQRRLPVPDKAIGREKHSTVHLWVVPAQVAGTWCDGLGHRLVLRQQFQRVDGLAQVPAAAQPSPASRATALWGRVQGERLDLLGEDGRAQLQLQAEVVAVAQGAKPSDTAAVAATVSGHDSANAPAVTTPHRVRQLHVLQADGPWARWQGQRLTADCPAG